MTATALHKTNTAKTLHFIDQEPPALAAQPLVMALDPTWIPQMLALQDAWGDDQVLMRDEADLKRHFAQGHTALGAFVDGRLVGQALITTEKLAQTDLSAMFANAAGVATKKPALCSTISGVITAGDMRGAGIMGKILDGWMARAEDKGCNLVRAWVRVGNPASLKNFLKKGVAVTDVGPSPNQNTHDVYSVVAPLRGKWDMNVFKTTRVDSASASDILDNLEQGYVGTGLDKNNNLIMTASHGLTL